jgi:hypothetical protein
MTIPRKRRLVGTFSAEIAPENGQELTKLPGRRAKPVSASSSVGLAPRIQPPETDPGEGAETAPDIELAALQPLSNEQIEEQLRKLAGPCLDLLGKLIACGTSGRKLPRNVAAAIGNAQWVVTEARKASKAAEGAADDKARAAKLDQARKLFSGGAPALTGELQRRTRVERSGAGEH